MKGAVIIREGVGKAVTLQGEPVSKTEKVVEQILKAGITKNGVLYGDFREADGHVGFVVSGTATIEEYRLKGGKGL